MNRHVLAVVLCFAGLLLAEDSNPAKPNKFESAIAQFEAQDKTSPPPAHPVLLVGSSSFRMWTSASKDLAPFTVVNRGFGGSTLPDVLHFFDRVVVPYRPQAILIYEGDNDLASGRSPEQFMTDVKSFMERVRKELPGTPVLFLSIKPSGKRWSLWGTIQEANQRLADYAATQPDVETVDVGTVLLGEDGKPLDALFRSDRLHLNPEGYKRWIEILKPRIEKLLNGKK